MDFEKELIFSDPGSDSALRVATKRNPRIYPCPECGEPEMLTKKDVMCGYRCDICAEGLNP